VCGGIVGVTYSGGRQWVAVAAFLVKVVVIWFRLLERIMTKILALCSKVAQVAKGWIGGLLPPHDFFGLWELRLLTADGSDARGYNRLDLRLSAESAVKI
jgi:hypothetical protein